MFYRRKFLDKLNHLLDSLLTFSSILKIFLVMCDNCSGYGIAAKALTAVIRAHDGRGPQTMLTNKILKALSLSSPDELIGYLFYLS